jgi:sterol desaturase/sphingolipid hydroxylase (fatty acid hydroxylase superfamily)
MHLPRKRAVERSGIFFRLNGHHILHHRYMHKNFNVVFPFADFCMGTLILRSKIAFAQPKGTAVPNLQPVEELPSFPRRVVRFFVLCLTGVR